MALDALGARVRRNRERYEGMAAFARAGFRLLTRGVMATMDFKNPGPAHGTTPAEAHR